MTKHYHKAYFLKSVADPKGLPLDKGFEVAIVGRSNSGKSSVLNQMTRNKSLARVSKTPGRTQLLNFFVLDKERRLVDLPGYGYAKVKSAIKQRFQKTIEAYLRERKSLVGMLIVMDIRHPLRPLDHLLLNYCEERDLPVHILLNKADKLSKSERAKVAKKLAEALTSFHNSVSFQVFSAIKGEGLPDLYQRLDEWFDFPS